MSKGDLVDVLADLLTGLDHALMTQALLDDPPNWQLVYALRKHLDDQQRRLLQEVLNEENPIYQTLTTRIETAAKTLNEVLAKMQQIDAVVSEVSKVSADVDQVLKLFP